jgi:hypothetical protein
MASTTNFNWSTPDDTSLVKDGAAAIRTLGQSIDTSMAELKGGTTGQVLSKTSNTDMDFTWVAQDDSNAIQNAIVDAKGDLIAATAADTPARLAVGNNGETLVADSSTSTGLRYQPARTQQLFLNSAFDIWQRGTSGASYVSSGGFVADRWQGIRGAAASGMTMSRQAAQNTALPNVQYAMRMQRDSGNTSTQDIRIFYSAESADSIPFAGQTITFSYYVRKGANYSGGDVTGTIYSGTGTDQNLGISGFTGSTAVVAVTRTSATLTSDWTRVQGTATVATTATQLGLLLSYTPTGTAGANDWIEITGMQLEVGSIATSFKRSSGTIQGELAACQRYYLRYSSNSIFTQFGFYGNANSTTNARASFVFPVAMRREPASIEYSTLAAYDGVTVNSVSAASMSFQTNLQTSVDLASTSLTQYRGYAALGNNSTSAYIAFSAEL